jgi:hypothetical protein
VIRTAALVLLLPIAGCDVEFGPSLTVAQFGEISRNCGLSPKVRLEQQGRDVPMIVLTDAHPTRGQVECIRVEKDRLGATADMAN